LNRLTQPKTDIVVTLPGWVGIVTAKFFATKAAKRQRDVHAHTLRCALLRADALCWLKRFLSVSVKSVTACSQHETERNESPVRKLQFSSSLK